MNVIFGIKDQCDTQINLAKYTCMWASAYISQSSDFALYREDYLMYECRTRDNESV